MATTILQKKVEPGDRGAVTRTVSGGVAVTKDPVFERLRESAKRNFTVLLHELPLYLHGKSMLVEEERLYQRLALLHSTRNDLVHAGAILSGQDRLPTDYGGMQVAVHAAIEAFHWFRASGRYTPSFGAP
jgi:hypothetical protein